MQKARDNIPRLCSMLDRNCSNTFSQSFVLCLCFLIPCTYPNYRTLDGFFIVYHHKYISNAYWRKPPEFFEWYINHPRFACKIVFFLAFNGPDKLKFAFSEQVVFLSNFQIANHSLSSIFLPKILLICLHTSLSSKLFFNRLDKCHSDSSFHSYSLLYHIILILANYTKN